MKSIEGVLKLYSDVKSIPVDWLWYPYIPSGKITLLQGDPGDGKSTMVMNLIACLTNADFTPDGNKVIGKKRVIYQCSEDSVSDTIKPRLEASGANCNRVAFIDEELMGLTLDSEKLREAIAEFKADLLVIDPVQAYLGDDINLASAKKIRGVLQRLNMWASAYKCAILLVGHMTKNESSKDLYRGLGSIDLVATARSVLQVYRTDENSTVRCIKHIKSSLAPKGKDIGFDISAENGFRWLGCSSDNSAEDWNKTAETNEITGMTKDEMIANYLRKLLLEGPVKAIEIQNHFIEKEIGIKALKRVKKIMGIKSVRKDGKWYWEL